MDTIELKKDDPMFDIRPDKIPFYVWSHFIAYVRNRDIQYSTCNLINAGWWYFHGWEKDIGDGAQNNS